MKFFVKVDENGELKLIEATQDQVLDGKTELFNEDGEQLRSQAQPSGNEGKTPMDELTNAVRDMALAVSGIGDIKQRQEEIETQIKAYQEAAAKGFPIPAPSWAAGAGADDDNIFAPYNMAIQGKALTDKISHPGFAIDDERRQAMAEYFVLFLKAGVFQDQRARAKMREKYGEVDPVTKTVIGDTGNVFPVPDIVDSEIIHFAREASVVLQECRIWNMTSEVESIPTETAGVTVSWGNTTQESEPTISETELTAKELSAYSAVRNTTLADARSDIVSWLTEVMAEAAGKELDNEAFNGDGSNVCSGLFSRAGYTVTAASALFSSITASDWSELIKNLDGLKKQNAKFYMSGTIIHYVRILSDDNSRPIFVETMGQPQASTIYGYPFRECIMCNATDGASKNVAIFGNLRYFALSRRLDASALSVDPYGLWTTNRTRFKLYQRWGMQVAQDNAFSKLVTAAS